VGGPHTRAATHCNPYACGPVGFVAYLAGPGADYMTGQAGLIDGGMVYR
jgi:hypothetical protein